MSETIDLKNNHDLVDNDQLKNNFKKLNPRPIILGYWKMHGIASSIRFLLIAVGADFIDELYSFDDKSYWFENKKYNLDMGIFKNLPYLIDNEVKMTEHTAIIRYLARKFNLAPKTEQEMQISDQTESFCYEISRDCYKVAYDHITYEKSKSDFIENTSKKLEYLENHLANNEYIVGTRLTYVDIYCFDLLLLISTFERSLINKNQNLINFINKINKLPNIEAYFKSGKHNLLKYCAPFAKWQM